MAEEKKAIEFLEKHKKSTPFIFWDSEKVNAILNLIKKQVDAIDLWKKYVESYKKDVEEQTKEIEKLQKENEELKKENKERSGLYQQAEVELENLREKTQKYYILLSKIRELEDMWNNNIWNATDDESKAKAEMIRDVYRGLLDE